MCSLVTSGSSPMLCKSCWAEWCSSWNEPLRAQSRRHHLWMRPRSYKWMEGASTPSRSGWNVLNQPTSNCFCGYVSHPDADSPRACVHLSCACATSVTVGSTACRILAQTSHPSTCRPLRFRRDPVESGKIGEVRARDRVCQGSYGAPRRGDGTWSAHSCLLQLLAAHGV